MKKIKKEHSLKVSRTDQSKMKNQKGSISKFRRPAKLADKVNC